MIAATATTVEVVWTSIGLVALILNARALGSAHDDRELLRESGRNGLLRMAANANVAREAYRVTQQALLVLAGAAALVSVNPGGPYRDSLGRSAVLVLFFVFQSGLVASAWLDYRVRKRMIEYDDDERERIDRPAR